MEILDDGEDDKSRSTDEVAAAATTAANNQDVVDGPIKHKSVFKLAVLDVVANFCVTLGFSVIGSGVRAIDHFSPPQRSRTTLDVSSDL